MTSGGPDPSIVYEITVPSLDVVVRFMPISVTLGPSRRRTPAAVSASTTKATPPIVFRRRTPPATALFADVIVFTMRD
jgi:hypothetical protein